MLKKLINRIIGLPFSQRKTDTLLEPWTTGVNIKQYLQPYLPGNSTLFNIGIRRVKNTSAFMPMISLLLKTLYNFASVQQLWNCPSISMLFVLSLHHLILSLCSFLLNFLLDPSDSIDFHYIWFDILLGLVKQLAHASEDKKTDTFITHNSSVCISYGMANEAKRKVFLNSMMVNIYIFKC